VDWNRLCSGFFLLMHKEDLKGEDKIWDLCMLVVLDVSYQIQDVETEKVKYISWMWVSVCDVSDFHHLE
jgi:hypothetical protein